MTDFDFLTSGTCSELIVFSSCFPLLFLFMEMATVFTCSTFGREPLLPEFGFASVFGLVEEIFWVGGLLDSSSPGVGTLLITRSILLVVILFEV